MLAFFGVVATCGSAYVQLERVPAAAVASLVVGLGAVAILLANNVRDIDGDRLAGKRTLAVRLGRDRSRDLFTAVVAAMFAVAACSGWPGRRSWSPWPPCPWRWPRSGWSAPAATGPA